MYIEPFVGSASFFLRLGPKHAILGDINRDLISFYRAIAKRPRDVSDRLTEMPTSAGFYYELRKRDGAGDRIDQAARFVYLNRYCFNGVYRTDKQGRFNVPRGIKVGSVPSIEEFLAFSRLLRNTRLFAGDFEECMESARPGDLAYLDPPYTTSERKPRGEYGYESFGSLDLDRLIRCLRKADKRGIKLLLSYKREPELRKALSSWYCKTLRVRRHVAGFAKHRSVTTEVLLANYQLPAQALQSGVTWAR